MNWSVTVESRLPTHLNTTLPAGNPALTPVPEELTPVRSEFPPVNSAVPIVDYTPAKTPTERLRVRTQPVEPTPPATHRNNTGSGTIIVSRL